MYRIHHEISNIAFSFAVHLIYPEFYMHFRKVTRNQNKNPSIRTQYILKMLYGRCYTEEVSLLLSGHLQVQEKKTFTRAL